MEIQAAQENLSGILLKPIGHPIQPTKMDKIGHKFFGQALKVVKDLHKAGWVHRDIKPMNFIEKNRRLYLLDLKSAANIEDKSNKGYIGGTNHFKSPFLSANHQ